MLLGTGFVFAAEIDDAAIFVDAFSAYQNKDYLTAIEKADQLNQIFPDSPLRDVTLLLIARSSFKSGNNERAAKITASFYDEFAESGLITTIEEDLQSLLKRHRNGERLPPNKPLQTAALKAREERLVQERAEAVKREQKRLAIERAERERIALEKIEAERVAEEKAAALKAAKESIKVVVTVKDHKIVTAGQTGSIPFEVSNRGKNSEEFVLVNLSPNEYAAAIKAADKMDSTINRVKLAAGETFKGSLTFRMPSNKVDGNRTIIIIKASSATYEDVSQQENALVIASAPLLRVVTKLVNDGKQLHYRMTFLNIGSIVAESLTVRVKLPEQLEFQNTPNLQIKQESDGIIVFNIEPVAPGKLEEINLNIKMRENSALGKKLVGHVEVTNGQLQLKEIFSTVASAAQHNHKP